MQYRRSVVPALVVTGWLLAALSCSSILGIEDTRVDGDGSGSGDGGIDPTCQPAEMACSGTCVELATDEENCGECGRACGAGSTCSDSKCSAVAIAPAQDAPISVAVTPSGEQVFWLNATLVYRCPMTGCTGRPFRVAEYQAFTFIDAGLFHDRLVATNDEVFWIGRMSNRDALLSCPTSGCSMSLPTQKPGHTADVPRGLSLLDASTLLMTQRFQAELCPLTGNCTFLNGVSADSMRSSVGDAARYYWLESTDPAGLYSLLRAGGTPQRMTSESGSVLRLHGDNLYALNGPLDKIYRCARTGCSGAGTPVVTGELTAGSSLAVDDRGIYWTVRGSATAATGEVRMCPLAGCPAAGPTVLATAQAQPTDLKLVGDFVVWANNGLTGQVDSGSIMKVRR